MILKMFPEIAEVFQKPSKALEKYFFPICTVDLATLNPKWEGTVPFLLFNEDPYNEKTAKYFNHYCEDNTIGFKVKNGKVALLTDLKIMRVSKKWKAWLKETQKGYQTSKEEFITKQGRFNYQTAIELGGKPDWIRGKATPKNKKGKKLKFIGQFDSSDFASDYCGKEIYVFYEPKEKVIVHRYQVH